MSIASKFVLAVATVTSSSIIAYVHYKQEFDRRKLHENIIREIERQRFKVENAVQMESDDPIDFIEDVSLEKNETKSDAKTTNVGFRKTSGQKPLLIPRREIRVALESDIENAPQLDEIILQMEEEPTEKTQHVPMSNEMEAQHENAANKINHPDNNKKHISENAITVPINAEEGLTIYTRSGDKARGQERLKILIVPDTNNNNATPVDPLKEQVKIPDELLILSNEIPSDSTRRNIENL